MSIKSSLGQQGIVIAALSQTFFSQNNNLIRMLDGAEPVGYDQGGPVLGKIQQGLLHQTFTLIIQRRGGLIQDQDGRVLQKDAGNR